MERFNYITITWVFAVLLHAFIWEGWVYYESREIGIDLFFLLIPMGLIFSAPAYLLCLWWSKFIFNLRTAAIDRFFTWLIAMILAIVISLQLTYLFIIGYLDFTLHGLSVALPGILAALLLTLIRYKQFFQLIKTSINENNLV